MIEPKDHWHTPPWTRWRLFELWARSAVALGWYALLVGLSASVSQEFLVFTLSTVSAILLLDATLPD